MTKELVLIGYGGMGTRHLQRLEKVSEIDVAGVFDIDPNKLKQAQADGYKTYTSYMAVLEDSNIDIVLIATPNDAHKWLAIDAMKAGKHVICEKPVTLSTKDFQEILDVAKAYHRCFMVDQNRRWDENYQIVKKTVNDGLIGKVYEIRNVVDGSRGIPKDWRREKEPGGGMVYDWCVHLLDRILMLKHDAKLTSVYGHLSYVLHHEVDDGFQVILTFDDDTRAVLEVGTVNFIKLPEWYVAGTTGTMEIKDFELHGEYVTLNGELAKDTVPVEAGAGFTKTMAPRTDDSVSHHALPSIDTDVCDFYRNFVNWIDGSAEPAVKNSEVMWTLKVIDMIFKSANLNQVINLEN
ncbi:Gfo/Idh/MocA family oxidoreductase [Pediococcus pentosaceus]|uniref:Gfo/Idh/MocA family protein n=1 Tax=Pediococcus pentosaceus TaxID=1255 RepID=UPI002F26B38C